MSGSHTPGPWSYVRNPENTRWIIDSAPSHAIACTAGFEPDNEANARLITAAPIMLATLEKYADQLCEGWCEQSPDCANFDDCGGCEARRIAWKAKGTEQ